MANRTPDIFDGGGNGGSGWTADGTENSDVKDAEAKTAPEDSAARNNYTTKTCKLEVVYKANGATGNPPSAFSKTYSGKLQPVTISTEVKDNENGMSKGSGYYFLGWSKTANGGVFYNPGDIIKEEWIAGSGGTKTYNLYAVWTNHSIFIYKPDEFTTETRYNYSDKPLNQQTVIKGVIFHRPGYTQTGWTTTPGGESEFIPGQTYTSTSDEVVVLYPVWLVNTYSITLYPNGGTGSVTTISLDYGTDVEIPLDNFTRNGYHINVWNEKADGTGTSWIPGATYTYTREANIKLYAIWAGNEYYFIYDDGTADSSKLQIRGELVSSLQKDGEDCLYSEDLHKTQDDLLYISLPGYAYFEIDDDASAYYSIATFGQPFYTERRPKPDGREYNTFDGWRIWSVLAGSYFNATKQDAWFDAYSILANPKWIWTNNIVGYAIWRDNYPFGKIFFGGKYSDDFGIYVEEPPSYEWPEYSYDHQKVNGKHGDVLINLNRFENVTKKYKISAYDGEDFYSVSKKVSEWLHHGFSGGYLRLEDSYEPDCYMLAVYEESNTLENQLGKAGKCEITFNCKPQKFLNSGDKRIDVISSGKIINNPTSYPSCPIVKFNGAGTIHINGVDITVYDNFNTITFDAETYDAVDVGGRNMNAYVETLNPIRLYPGDNTIAFEGGIYNLSIVPRWWRV